MSWAEPTLLPVLGNMRMTAASVHSAFMISIHIFDIYSHFPLALKRVTKNKQSGGQQFQITPAEIQTEEDKMMNKLFTISLLKPQL